MHQQFPPVQARTAGSAPATWFLKVDESHIRGPISLQTLREWAETAAIAPDDQVSPDGNSWQPASSLPVLSMEWLADLGGGQSYGPFNILAAPKLVERGVLHPDSALRKRFLNPEAGPETPRPAPPPSSSPATAPLVDQRVAGLEGELRQLRMDLARLQDVRAEPQPETGARPLIATGGENLAPAIDQLLDKVHHTEQMIQRLVQSGEPPRVIESTAEMLPAAPAARMPLWTANRRPLTPRQDVYEMEPVEDVREMARMRRFRVQTMRWNVINSSMVISTGAMVGAVGVMLEVEPVKLTGLILSGLGIIYLFIALLVLMGQKLMKWFAVVAVTEMPPGQDTGHPVRGVLNITFYWFNRHFRPPPPGNAGPHTQP